MVNCNPETVSTDYDTSDRLYFEPLTAEDVLEIIAVEQSKGRLQGRDRAVRRADAAQARRGAGGGRRADPRHLARRHRPRRGPRPVQGAGRQARAQAARERHRPHARRGAQRRRAARLSRDDPPVLRAGRAGHGDRGRRRRDRPLRGATVGHARSALRARRVCRSARCSIDRYLADAIEVDVDCLSDGKDTFIAGIMEHIEEAGIHSGRQRLLAARPFARVLDPGAAREADPRPGAGAQGRRPDERAVRGEGATRSTSSRSTRAPRARCRSSPR